jgi:hypothetical protein
VSAHHTTSDKSGTSILMPERFRSSESDSLGYFILVEMEI